MVTWSRKTGIRTLLLMGLVAGLFLTRGHPGTPVGVAIPAWLLIVFGTELLWHPARTGLSAITMAPAAHVATLVLLPGPWGIAVNTLAAFAGSMVIRRQRVRVAAGYASAVVIASAATWGLVLLMGLQFARPLRGGAFPVPTLLELGLLGVAGVVYHLLNQGLICWATGRVLRHSLLRHWRETFGYRTELVTTLGLIIVSGIAVLGYQVLGFRGVLLCVMPLLFVRDGSRRYIELELAQAKLIVTERLAAKGEMAAEIGHELNNYLAAISGRAQLLTMNGTLRGDPAWSVDVDRIRDLSVNMSGLARGLMDFSHREARRKRFEVVDLVQRTVDLVKPQARYRDVRFEIHDGGGAPGVEMDPGQIQQVLLTLFGRAAGDGAEGRPAAVEIRTAAEPRGRTVMIDIVPRRTTLSVEEPSGEPASVEAAADPELGTVRRILERHRGRFETLASAESGEFYRLTLPAA